MPPDLDAALERVAAALAAMGSGDPAPVRGAVGGRARRHAVRRLGARRTRPRDVTRTFEWVASRFSDGALVPRHDVLHADGDLAVTVGFEHGDVRVDGGELRPMTLRVTHVLRRIDGDWRLVHRHADFPPADQRRP